MAMLLSEPGHPPLCNSQCCKLLMATLQPSISPYPKGCDLQLALHLKRCMSITARSDSLMSTCKQLKVWLTTSSTTKGPIKTSHNACTGTTVKERVGHQMGMTERITQSNVCASFGHCNNISRRQIGSIMRSSRSQTKW